MPLIAKNESTPRELTPAGSYFAVVNGVFDLGTQDGGQYGAKHQVLVTWELHKRKGPATDAQGNVRTIAKFFTLSLNEKANLRADVEAMTGLSFSEEEVKGGYDVMQLLGVPCRLQVAHKVKTDGTKREEIQSFMPLDEEDIAPEPATDHLVYELDTARAIPDQVPKWVAKLILKSQEWRDHQNGVADAYEPAAANAAASPKAPGNNDEFDEFD